MAAPLDIRRSRLYCLRGGGAIFVACLLLGIVAYLFPHEVLTVDSGSVKADAMLVLGGGGGERPERAAELFKTSEAPLVMCIGYGDAAGNKAYLINSGVPASSILLESKSRTTQENAKFAIAMLRAQHLKSVIIVTSWFHSRRALACFEHYAPDIKFYSRPCYVGYPAKAQKGYVRAEYVKLLGYWLRYGVCPL